MKQVQLRWQLEPQAGGSCRAASQGPNIINLAQKSRVLQAWAVWQAALFTIFFYKDSPQCQPG